MGCDIHFYVERRDGDRWVSCDTWEKSEYGEGVTVPYGKHYFDTRSYDTFAILANVRNGRGFAGCDTGDGFEPICEPRGLPSDMSPEMRAEADAFLEHTPTWLLVRELLDYDWTRTATKRGWVNGREFHDWGAYRRGDGEGPRKWSGVVSGGGVEHITEQEMVRRIADIKSLMPGANYRDIADAIAAKLGRSYCAVSWQTPYYKAARVFLSETMPRLWRLGAPEDVRCVFWFDS